MNAQYKLNTNFKEERENLFNQLKDELEITKAEDFKFHDTIEDFKEIINKFEKLRFMELIKMDMDPAQDEWTWYTSC